jgi:hypothetical protein
MILAEKMLMASANKYSRISVGDSVSIRPPKEYRGKGDPRNLLAVVTAIDGDFYKLGTRAG